MGLFELQGLIYKLSYNCDLIARIGDNPSDVVLRSWSYSPKIAGFPVDFRLETPGRELGIDLEKNIAQIVEWASVIIYHITEHDILKYYTRGYPKLLSRDFIVFRDFSIKEVFYFICFLHHYSVDCGIDINYIFEKKGLSIRIKRGERGDTITVYSSTEEFPSKTKIDALFIPGKITSHTKNTVPVKSLPEFFCEEATAMIIKTGRIIPGCKGKKVATIIRALQELGYITLASGEYKQLYRAIRAHYNIDIGADSGITKYLSGNNQIPGRELEDMKKQLQ